jgi:hypothetical protein
VFLGLTALGKVTVRALLVMCFHRRSFPSIICPLLRH